MAGAASFQQGHHSNEVIKTLDIEIYSNYSRGELNVNGKMVTIPVVV